MHCKDCGRKMTEDKSVAERTHYWGRLYICKPCKLACDFTEGDAMGGGVDTYYWRDAKKGEV